MANQKVKPEAHGKSRWCRREVAKQSANHARRETDKEAATHICLDEELVGMDETDVADVEGEAVLRWLETGEGDPWK